MTSRATALFGCLALFVANCGDGASTNIVEDGNAVTQVDITPHQDTLPVGTSVQCFASLLYADGTTKDVTLDAGLSWNTSNVDVASITPAGLVTGLLEGQADITATYKGVTASRSIAVTP